MKFAILTSGELGIKIYNAINAKKGNHCVYSFVDGDCTKWVKKIGNTDLIDVISLGKAYKLYSDKMIDKFIMPSMEESLNENLANLLRAVGVREEDILYAPAKLLYCKDLTIDERFDSICQYSKRRELETIEIHAAEHCNLNCKNCSMFCGLVKKPTFSDFDKTKEGIKNLKKYFDHVKKIRIIGGEPLLNKELYKFVELIRGEFPFADIRLITNGILVKQMDDKLINALRENNVTVIITAYKPIAHKMDELHAFLDEKCIKHEITDIIVKFQKIYNYRGNACIEDNFRKCHWRGGCATLYNNRLAACFVPFVIKYLSDTFDLKIKGEGFIDLSEKDLSTEKIRNLLNTPFDTCRYCCFENRTEAWDIIDSTKPEKISDWSI